VILKERARIEGSPERVFRFFEEIETHYEEWHPDHITFRWMDGNGLEQGNKAYFEEEIGGEMMKKTVRFVAVEDGRYIELRPTGRLLGFFLPYISFSFEPDGDGCEFTQRIKIRTGPIGRRLNRDEFDAVQQHMVEEGENLRTVIESGA